MFLFYGLEMKALECSAAVIVFVFRHYPVRFLAADIQQGLLHQNNLHMIYVKETFMCFIFSVHLEKLNI